MNTNCVVYQDDGSEVSEGSQITSFRGEKWTFLGVVRLPELGKSPKVRVRSEDEVEREFYATVFGLSVVRLCDEGCGGVATIVDTSDNYTCESCR